MSRHVKVVLAACALAATYVGALEAQQSAADSTKAAAAASIAAGAPQEGARSAEQRAALNLRTANDSALERLTTAVASELRCPVCQGLSLQASPSELAQQMRGLVKEQLASGKTPDQVKAYFVSKYGEWILLAPKAQGFNLLVYLLPALVVVGGGAFVYVMVRRWSNPSVGDIGTTQDHES